MSPYKRKSLKEKTIEELRYSMKCILGDIFKHPHDVVDYVNALKNLKNWAESRITRTEYNWFKSEIEARIRDLESLIEYEEKRLMERYKERMPRRIPDPDMEDDMPF